MKYLTIIALALIYALFPTPGESAPVVGGSGGLLLALPGEYPGTGFAEVGDVWHDGEDVRVLLLNGPHGITPGCSYTMDDLAKYGASYGPVPVGFSPTVCSWIAQVNQIAGYTPPECGR